MSEDRGRAALDSLLTDLANDQRNRGLIPNVTDAKAYLVPVIEKIERTPKPVAVVKQPEQAHVSDKVQDKARELGWSVDRRTFSPTLPKHVRKKLTQIEQRIRARIRLLTTKSEWVVRLKQINPLALSGTLGEDKRKHAAMLVMQLLDDSNRVFGDWRKPKSTKLYSK